MNEVAIMEVIGYILYVLMRLVIVPFIVAIMILMAICMAPYYVITGKGYTFNI